MNIFVGQMVAVHLQRTLTFAVLTVIVHWRTIGIISRITLLAERKHSF